MELQLYEYSFEFPQDADPCPVLELHQRGVLFFECRQDPSVDNKRQGYTVHRAWALANTRALMNPEAIDWYFNLVASQVDDSIVPTENQQDWGVDYSSARGMPAQSEEIQQRVLSWNKRASVPYSVTPQRITVLSPFDAEEFNSLAPKMLSNFEYVGEAKPASYSEGGSGSSLSDAEIAGISVGVLAAAFLGTVLTAGVALYVAKRRSAIRKDFQEQQQEDVNETRRNTGWVSHEGVEMQSVRIAKDSETATAH